MRNEEWGMGNGEWGMGIADQSCAPAPSAAILRQKKLSPLHIHRADMASTAKHPLQEL